VPEPHTKSEFFEASFLTMAIPVETTTATDDLSVGDITSSILETNRKAWVKTRGWGSFSALLQSLAL
jgi:hypothetical protein